MLGQRFGQSLENKLCFDTCLFFFGSLSHFYFINIIDRMQPYPQAAEMQKGK